jgi:hypothetical protein
MPIELVSDTPQWETRTFRVNFTWMINGVWDEDRFEAFHRVMGRRKDATWTRRPYPYEIHVGFSTIECSVPLPDESQVPALQEIILRELQGMLAAANVYYAEILAEKGAKDLGTAPPESPAPVSEGPPEEKPPLP